MHSSPQELAEALGEAEPRGGEWYALCPAHDDTSPSLAIADKDGKIVWVCRAGCDGNEVLKQLQARGLWPERKRAGRSKPATPAKRKPAKARKGPDAVEGRAPATIIAEYDYTDSAGRLIAQVVRFQPKGFRQRMPNGKRGWTWKLDGLKLPIYRLPQVLASSGPVLIVEGEKDVEALEALGFAATCNAGGAGKWRPDHSESLGGRDAVIIPDNDGPGRDHAQRVAASLSGTAKSVRIATVPEPHKDISDAIQAGMSRQGVSGLIRRSEPYVPEPEPAVEPDATLEPADPDGELSDQLAGAAYGDAPFRAIGHEHGSLYYYSYLTRQVVHATGPADAESKMLLLAPLHWWEARFSGLDKQGTRAAKSHMIQAAIDAGIYDPRLVRGRGAWFDDGRIVLHCGSHLIVDGAESQLVDFESRYTYELGIDYPIAPGNPLPPMEAHRYIELCQMIFWQRPIDALLLAGWVALAPFCGALDWRPHVSIAGESGSGKTWIVENLIRAMLRGVGADFVSSSTEASIRQTLKADARPVVMDEIEPNTPQAREQIQSILKLARAASSNNEAPITKGSPSGNVMLFYPRYMFCYAGIVESAIEMADRNRTSVLQPVAMPQNENKIAHFQRLESEQASLITAEYVQRFRARTLMLLPTIINNAKVFRDAWKTNRGNARTGDHVGVLLAGAYSLHSNKPIKPDAALDFIRRHDWSDERALEQERDPIKVMQAILRHTLQVKDGNFSGERSVGELVEIAARGYVVSANTTPGSEGAHGYLQRMGLRIEGGAVLVATKPEFLAPILGKTPWATGHGRLLGEIDGAERPANPVRFAGLTLSRAVRIPLKSIEPHEPEPGEAG